MSAAKPTFVLKHVELITRDRSRLVAFYRDALGFVARENGSQLTLHFTPDAPPAITFIEDRAALEANDRVAGLFHIALLLPDRATLAAALARLLEHHQPIDGLSDHGVSEAIYLSDPDGNGLELYRDRARSDWPMAGDHVAMVTLPLEPNNLLRDRLAKAPASPLTHATLGHIHLRASVIDASQNFYTKELGLAIRQDNYTGAVFMAADGYHHHVAVNNWGHPAQRPGGPISGLLGFTAASSRVTEPISLDDPDGIRVTLEPR